MKTTEAVIEEQKKKFKEYMINGYSGGEDGLRCDNCDERYSGIADVNQLCPMCLAEQSMQKAVEAERERIEYYIDNTLALLGIYHGINEMTGSWINYEDLKEFINEQNPNEKITNIRGDD